MKRSEILEKMVLWAASQGLSKDFDKLFITMDKILTIQENEGLLPPIEKGAEQYKTLCKWEPEDEKK